MQSAEWCRVVALLCPLYLLSFQPSRLTLISSAHLLSGQHQHQMTIIDIWTPVWLVWVCSSRSILCGWAEKPTEIILKKTQHVISLLFQNQQKLPYLDFLYGSIWVEDRNELICPKSQSCPLLIMCTWKQRNAKYVKKKHKSKCR